jgi:hypothetical protein
VVRWKSESSHLQDLCLEVVGSWLATLGAAPSVRTVRTAFDRLAQIFAALDGPSARDVTGLWGELLLIASAEDPEMLVRAWHVEPGELHDFQFGRELLEMKATTTGIRRHDFFLAQLTWPGEARLVIASIMLTSDAPTMTLTDLVECVKARLSTDELRLRVDAIVVATLGAEALSALSHRFNGKASASSLRFFEGAVVPTVVRNLPVAVSDVRFKVELDGLEALSNAEMSAAGSLFRVARRIPEIGGSR